MPTQRFPARRWFPLVFPLLFALVAATPAAAQDRLPSSMLNASSLTSSQEREIEAFVSEWNTQLLEGSDSEIAEARQALLQPVRSSTSDAFLDPYGEAVGETLSTALEARRLITRLNAMIVAGELGGRGVRGVIVKGLGDPSPAVNYWAASGVVKLAEARARGARIPTRAVRDVLDSLDQMLEARQASNPLLYPTLQAAVVLNVPEGDTLFLDTLASRIELHVRQPRLDYGPALETRGWPRLIQRSISEDTPHNREVLQRSALIATQTLAVITRQFEEGQLGDRPPQSHIEMMRWSQRLLATVNRALDGPASAPDTNEVQNAIEDLDANFLRLTASNWIATLKKPPYGFSADELEIPEP